MSDPIHAALSERIDRTLLPLLAAGSGHICIIDPPGHPNVGDSAILLGELNFIARHFPKASLSHYDVGSYGPAADRFIEEATVLLVHGGGNFGDIWPHHHRLRMRILERFPHKPVLQMPQSIHFDDAEVLRATAATIGRHRDFTLAVRDHDSLEYARLRFDCRTVLCPDMAFAMRPVLRRPPVVDCLGLLRTDKETIIDRDAVHASLAATGLSIEIADWLDEPRDLTARLDRRVSRLTRKLPAATAPFRSAAMRLRRRYARRRVAYGIGLLSHGSAVVTDRLHAHIMCCLLGIPHWAFDSYDGKISAFHATWTKEYRDARMATRATQVAEGLGAALRPGR